ncbi:ABC transporter permease [Sandaracinus amylolyticus]|uniref:Gliding motility protein GldF n=1 Tax=Sandaracinus amylolyticus TaxID=927083 RepID=A0A0F6W3B4_9BACT|nr:ABC transporter permease [Sandaracinus amylolyticus]AKF06418.1 gliding motility protein GldF [Sandaracinus amylolyticus]
MWTIAKREIVSFFVSPLAYVVLTAWMVICGFEFYLLAAFAAGQPLTAGAASEGLLAQYFGGTTLFYMPLLVIVPLLTMRLIAEESRAGTIEPLLTAPVSETAIVLGKFVAAMVFWSALFVPTLMYAWLTSRFGDVDLGALGATYFGLLLLGLSWMSVGTLMSAIGRNQIVAAMLTFLAVAGHFMIGLGQFVFPDDGAREVFEYVSVWGQMSAFATGVVDTRYLVWDLSTAALALFVAVRVLEARRYEG